MKKTLWRALALCLSLVMLFTLTGCPDKTEGDIYSSVQEEGTEEELTAVRENLIKYTELKGFGDVEKMEFYENGVRTKSDEYWQVKDNKKIYWSGDIKRVVNYTDGYILDIPNTWKPDYSMSSMRVRYDTEEVSLIASREDDAIAYHGSLEVYMDSLYLYLKNEDFQKNNGITVVADVEKSTISEDWTMEVYKVKLEDCPAGTKCYYTYVDYYNDLGETVHMMFKAIDDRDFSDVYNSFQGIYQKGAPVDTRLYPCMDNPNWSDETKDYYHALKEQEHVDWGLFSYKLQTTGIEINIPVLEKKFDYTFPVISEYIHYGSKENINDELKVGEFPLDFANEMDADGRMMQITYQYTVNNNMDLTFQNPILDIYRGTDEAKATITQFAQGAAEYGKPFFFRLNNEMNTDWTSYCGMANMLDPDIFVDTWVALYDVFTETGANQYAMWIFNGFDKSYPPYNWCNYQCYMPKSEYIDLIGLTGYNMGSNPDTGYGSWSTFPELYDGISAEYTPHFAEWPWIISEFGCVARDDVEGQGPDAKAAWITEMFDCFEQNKYPNIKVAVWFNANDYTPEGKVSNELVLDTDKVITDAFAEGLARTQP